MVNILPHLIGDSDPAAILTRRSGKQYNQDSRIYHEVHSKTKKKKKKVQITFY